MPRRRWLVDSSNREFPPRRPSPKPFPWWKRPIPALRTQRAHTSIRSFQRSALKEWFVLLVAWNGSPTYLRLCSHGHPHPWTKKIQDEPVVSFFGPWPMQTKDRGRVYYVRDKEIEVEYTVHWLWHIECRQQNNCAIMDGLSQPPPEIDVTPRKEHKGWHLNGFAIESIWLNYIFFVG